MSELPEELQNRPPRKPGHEPTAVLTLDAYQRLKAELDDLKGRGRTQMGERLLRAREHGDIRENAEYDSAKNDQGLMEARIRDLDRMLRDPEIVEVGEHAEEITPGMLVTVRDEDGDEDTYLLAHSAEERADGARTITMASPLGAQLVGKGSGDDVTYEAPAGAFTVTIVSFEPYRG
jgi:transcription elongation factor GreA